MLFMEETISKELSCAFYIQRAKKFRTKKRLGQNFLINPEIINTIVSNVKEDDVVLEIGPGVGFVTEKLVKTAKKVTAVELDEDAVGVLEKNLGGCGNFTLIHNDILKTNLEDIFKEEKLRNKKIKIVANIPYYITSPIIAHLLGEIDEINNKNRLMIDEIILMVQYEVARRIVADNGAQNKEYGMLSILSQFWADCSIIKNVSKKCFYPSPKVDSAIVKIKINNKPKCEITPLLRRTIKAAFLQRRKNIKNSLQNAGFLNVEDALKACGIDIQTRGEKLSIQDFCALSKALEEVQNSGARDSGVQVSGHAVKKNIVPIKLEAGSVPNFEKMVQLKDWILENLSLLGVIEIKSNGRKVQFSKSSINRSLKDAGRKDARRESYSKLKELLENALFGTIKNVDAKHKNRVSGQEIYYNAFIYNDKIYGVEISIDIPRIQNAFYMYAGHKIKNIKTTPGISEVSSKEGLLDSTGAATISITDIKQLFNPIKVNKKD